MSAYEVLIRVIASVILITLVTLFAMSFNLFRVKGAEPYMVFFVVTLVLCLIELTVEKVVRK